MTRIKVLQIGLIFLLIGPLTYELFKVSGFDGQSAGIAAEALLVALVIVWTSTYLLRVVTGQMTFMEQRKRYRKVYDRLTEVKLREKFDAMTDEQKEALISDLEKEKN